VFNLLLSSHQQCRQAGIDGQDLSDGKTGSKSLDPYRTSSVGHLIKVCVITPEDQVNQLPVARGLFLEVF